MKTLSLLPVLALAFSLPSVAQDDKPLELSIGAVKDQVNASATRVLAKYADKFTYDEALKSPAGGTFYQLSRKFTIDTADDNRFGGVRLRYGILGFSLPTKTTMFEGKPVIENDFDALGHVFGLRFGADTDRRVKVRDYLAEAMYMPFKFTDSPCFKLSPDQGIALIGQLGRSDPGNGGPTTSLRRAKLEGQFITKFSCLMPTPGGSSSSPGRLLAADIGNWQLRANAQLWRDFEARQSYRRFEATVRIPIAADKFVDLTRIVGADAPTFIKGSQFSANLTVAY